MDRLRNSKKISLLAVAILFLYMHLVYRGATEDSLAFLLWGEVTCPMGDVSHIIYMVWLAWLSQDESAILLV
jgi:hypothetical protein